MTDKKDKKIKVPEFVFPHAGINTKPFGDKYHAKYCLFGGYIDRKLSDLTSLYCVYTEQSKTALLRELVQQKSKEYPSEKEMMENICRMHLDYWIEFLEGQEVEEDIQYEYRKKRLWKEYKEGLKKELIKIIPKYYANFVINYLEAAQF